MNIIIVTETFEKLLESAKRLFKAAGNSLEEPLRSEIKETLDMAELRTRVGRFNKKLENGYTSTLQEEFTKICEIFRQYFASKKVEEVKTRIESCEDEKMLTTLYRELIRTMEVAIPPQDIIYPYLEKAYEQLQAVSRRIEEAKVEEVQIIERRIVPDVYEVRCLCFQLEFLLDHPTTTYEHFRSILELIYRECGEFGLKDVSIAAKTILDSLRGKGYRDSDNLLDVDKKRVRELYRMFKEEVGRLLL